MKKIAFGLIIILIAVFIILEAAGRGSEYYAEKMLNAALQNYTKLMQNPDVVPSYMLQGTIMKLREVINKYPKSATARRAFLSALDLMLFNKKYDEAMSTADEILKLYPDEYPMETKAFLAKAGIFEVRNQWNKSLTELNTIKRKYPYTQVGLQIPIYIAVHYKLKGDMAATKKAYDDAAAYYKTIREKNPKTRLGYMSSSLLTQCYINLARLEDAGKLVENILVEYASPIAYAQQLPLIEYIYVRNLKMNKKAIEILESVKEKVNNPNFKKLIEAKIKKYKNPKKK